MSHAHAVKLRHTSTMSKKDYLPVGGAGVDIGTYA
jgi:hypothetical protein